MRQRPVIPGIRVSNVRETPRRNGRHALDFYAWPLGRETDSNEPQPKPINRNLPLNPSPRHPPPPHPYPPPPPPPLRTRLDPTMCTPEPHPVPFSLNKSEFTGLSRPRLPQSPSWRRLSFVKKRSHLYAYAQIRCIYPSNPPGQCVWLRPCDIPLTSLGPRPTSSHSADAIDTATRLNV